MKKVLFSTMLLAGILASCSDEEFGTANGVGTTDGRTQIDLILNGNVATTRMAPTEGGFTYTPNDKLGAVLVDGGMRQDGSREQHLVNWSIVDSHVGNNKWNWDGSRFVTEGTTSVGAWLFYTRYNKDMTTGRGGVEYTFPQIQEYADDYEWLANNNVNFAVSPIYRIDGYEGEKVQFNVYQGSIHSIVKLNLQLPTTVSQVQKIVLTAKDMNGGNVEFPTKGYIRHTQLEKAGVVANMLQRGGSSFDSQYELEHLGNNTVLEDMNAESLKAFYNFMNSDGTDPNGKPIRMDGEFKVDLAKDTDSDLQGKYTEITKPVTDNTVKFLVLDCVENHEDIASEGTAVTGGKFTSYMLVPAGIYQSITLYVYTEDGIYKQVVDRRDMAVDEDESSLADNQKAILLRRHTRVNLANITKKASAVENAAIKIEDMVQPEMVASELGGVVVTKTADLIAAIDGATQPVVKFNVVNQPMLKYDNDGDKAVPAHTTLINKAVADATEAMIGKYGSDVELIFQNSEMTIKGEGTPYNLKHMTFQKGCKLTTGSINVADQINFEKNTFKVQKGATANFTIGVANAPEEYLNSSKIENEGTVNFKKYTTMDIIENKDGGVVNVEQSLKVAGNMKNYEAVVVTEKGTLKVNNLTNVGTEGNVTYNATVVNNNDLTFEGVGRNSGVITNNKKVEIECGESTRRGMFTNLAQGEIINAEGATFIAQKTGTMTNEMRGTITNAGELYCIIEGDAMGQINNYGTIVAETGALTYITNNQVTETQSDADLKKDDIDETNIGRIILKERGSNMSVSTANMQGIIEYTLPVNTNKWTPQDGDKFNKLILENTVNGNGNPVDLTALNGVTGEDGITKVISVELSGNSYVKFAEGQALKELIIDGNINVLGQKVSTAILRVMEGDKLTIPTNNVFGVYSFKDETGNAVDFENQNLYINNHATILVGGRFYTRLPQSITSEGGEFASGAGEEAYIFDSADNSWKKSVAQP